jgi:RNA polymerase sigma factor (sigma-70 family)
MTDRSDRWEAALCHRDRLVRLAKAKGAGSDAEDLVHDALLKVVQQENVELQRMGSYLSKTVSNLVIDHFRKNAVRQRLVQSADIDEAVSPIEEGVLERMVAERTAPLLRELPKDVKAILEDRLQGMTWRQISSKLDLPVSLIEMRVRRESARFRNRCCALVLESH